MAVKRVSLFLGSAQHTARQLASLLSISGLFLSGSAAAMATEEDDDEEEEDEEGPTAAAEGASKAV